MLVFRLFEICVLFLQGSSRACSFFAAAMMTQSSALIILASFVRIGVLSICRYHHEQLVVGTTGRSVSCSSSWQYNNKNSAVSIHSSNETRRRTPPASTGSKVDVVIVTSSSTISNTTILAGLALATSQGSERYCAVVLVVVCACSVCVQDSWCAHY